MVNTKYARINSTDSIEVHIIEEFHSFEKVLRRLPYKKNNNELFKIDPDETIYIAITEVYKDYDYIVGKDLSIEYKIHLKAVAPGAGKDLINIYTIYNMIGGGKDRLGTGEDAIPLYCREQEQKYKSECHTTIEVQSCPTNYVRCGWEKMGRENKTIFGDNDLYAYPKGLQDLFERDVEYKPNYILHPTPLGIPDDIGQGLSDTGGPITAEQVIANSLTKSWTLPSKGGRDNTKKLLNNNIPSGIDLTKAMNGTSGPDGKIKKGAYSLWWYSQKISGVKLPGPLFDPKYYSLWYPRPDYDQDGYFIGEDGENAMRVLQCVPKNQQNLCSTSVWDTMTTTTKNTFKSTGKGGEDRRTETFQFTSKADLHQLTSMSFKQINDFAQGQVSTRILKQPQAAAKGWLDNYRGDRDDKTMKERIDNGEFNFWPCGIQKDPMSINKYEELALCSDSKKSGILCDPKKTRFCNSGWEFLRYDPTVAANRVVLDSGERYKFGMCYDPTNTKATNLCEKADYDSNVSEMQKIFTPIIAARMQAQYQAVIDKIEEKKKELWRKFAKELTIMVLTYIATWGLNIWLESFKTSAAAATLWEAEEDLKKGVKVLSGVKGNAEVWFLGKAAQAAISALSFVGITAENTQFRGLAKFILAADKAVTAGKQAKADLQAAWGFYKSLSFFNQTAFAAKTTLALVNGSAFGELFQMGPFNLVSNPLSWIRMYADPDKNTGHKWPGTLATIRTLYKTLHDEGWNRKASRNAKLESLNEQFWSIALDTYLPFLSDKKFGPPKEDRTLTIKLRIDTLKKFYSQSRKLYKYQLSKDKIEESLDYHSGINYFLFNTSMKNKMITINNANIRTSEERLHLNTMPNKKPMKIFNFKNNDVNSGFMIAYEAPLEFNNDTSNVEVGITIDNNLFNSIQFSQQANPQDYKVMEYDTTYNFIKPYTRKVLHRDQINKLLVNTTKAYERLTKEFGFDIPFSPYRQPVSSTDIGTGTVIQEPYFIGNDLSTNISDAWWNYYNTTKPSEKAFNNRYLQFMSLNKYDKPTTTCASFCNLFDTDENKNDASFNKFSKLVSENCKTDLLEDKEHCYMCEDSTPEELLKNNSHVEEYISCEDLANGLGTKSDVKGKSCDDNIISAACPRTCGFCGPGDVYLVKSGGVSEKVNCNKPKGFVEQCAKTCGVCNNITTTCNCLPSRPPPLPRIYLGKSFILQENTLSNYFNTTWSLLGKSAWWYPASSIEIDTNNKLTKYPTNCNEFCQMKSSLGYTDPSNTPYGAPTGDVEVCKCSSVPEDCVGCISYNWPNHPNPLSLPPEKRPGQPITNCDDYCRVLYLGNDDRDGFTVFGECGNSSGSEKDVGTNCCNCFQYDAASNKVKILNQKRDENCAAQISQANTCGIKGIKDLGSCTDLVLSDNEACEHYATNYGTGEWYTCREDDNNNKKCKASNITCEETLKNLSANLKGCDVPNNKATSIVMPPRPLPFRGKIGPTPAPDAPESWPKEIKKSCTTLSADIISPYICENYCENPNIKDADKLLCEYCKDCSNISTIYLEREFCIGKLLDFSSNANNTCADNYEKYNICNNVFAEEPHIQSTIANSNYKQCVLTPNNKCVAATNLCKLPNRVDNNNEITRGRYSESNTTYIDGLHHKCLCNVERNNCTPIVFNWTTSQFSQSAAKNEVTKPLYGVNGVVSTGNRGGLCKTEELPPLAIPAVSVCAKDLSHAFLIEKENKITCNKNSDCNTNQMCYKQSGVFCTNYVGNDGSNCISSHDSCHITTKDEICSADYGIEVSGTLTDGTAELISNSDGTLTVSCASYNREDFISKAVYCQPRNIIKEGYYPVKNGDTCAKIAVEVCGKGTKCNSPDDCPIICDANTVCQPENLVQGKSVKYDCNNSGMCNSKSSLQDCCGRVFTITSSTSGHGKDIFHREFPKYLNPVEQTKNDHCAMLPTPEGEGGGAPSNGTPCKGYILWDQQATGAQCYYDKSKEKCVWTKNNNPGNISFCKAPNPVMCSDINEIDPSLCIGYNRPNPDCSSSFPIDSNPLDGSLCLGYLDTGSENYQCVWKEASNSCVQQDTSCNLSRERDYLGIAAGPSICENVNPDPKTGKCLAYYTLPEKKPRLYDGSYLEVFHIGSGDSKKEDFSIAKPWYDSSLHTLHCVGDHDLVQSMGGDFTIERCAELAASLPLPGLETKEDSGFYFSPNTPNARGGKGICHICASDPDKIKKYGPATINIVDKATEGEGQDKQYKYYSKTPEIWVSKDVSYAYEPYNCADESPIWPTTTGMICKEDPVGTSCQGQIEDSNINPGELPWRQGYGCKTTILPLPKTTRTCILQPTPAPINQSTIFNHHDNDDNKYIGWNLIPWRNYSDINWYEGNTPNANKYSLNKSWPEFGCVKALPKDVALGKYDFSSYDECNKAAAETIGHDNTKSKVTKTDITSYYKDCDRFLGERCEAPKIVGGTYRDCDKNEQFQQGCSAARRMICAAGRGSTKEDIISNCDLADMTAKDNTQCNSGRLTGGVENGISQMEKAYCPGYKAESSGESKGSPRHCSFEGLEITKAARNPYSSCGSGMGCYATGTSERTFNQLNLCSKDSEECRCLYTHTGKNSSPAEWVGGNNGSLSCNEFCEKTKGPNSMCVGIEDKTGGCVDENEKICKERIGQTPEMCSEVSSGVGVGGWGRWCAKTCNSLEVDKKKETFAGDKI